MNETSSFEKANNKMEHRVTDNDGNNGSVVHTSNECGKSFKEISSLNGHKRIHRREEHMRMMAEQQPITVMVDKCTTMVANQIVSSGSIAVDSSNGVSRMNKTSSSKRTNKKEHPLIEIDDNNGTMVHTCNECGKSFKEISSPNGHKGIH
ncbi:unnamed protein product [Miscanthus lutarioriparius]|uniref:C2H2-type domain-containing protein n=1 Tax=Miscanthus lutarioriparius TaxID=422564 RepID=A0A811RQ03_9POAL|nr:unnamed protein product [Miscanthus lutarioriparius]